LTNRRRRLILNLMVNYNDGRLDAVFSALSDPTRRGILAALAGGGRPVTSLAQPFDMSLPGFMKHLRILEDAGLLEREKEGRVVNCMLAAGPMREAVEWLERYKAFWEERLDALARYLEQENEPWPPSEKNRRSRSSASSKPPRKKSGARSRNRTR
jgi:DNA-binding transcriptional ArsR family regulator